MSCVLWRSISNFKAGQTVIASLAESFSVLKEWLLCNINIHNRESLGAQSWGQAYFSQECFYVIHWLLLLKVTDLPSEQNNTHYFSHTFKEG